MKKAVVLYMATLLGLIIPTQAQAKPVQCYIGKDGSYQICDLRSIQYSNYLLIWPGGNRTAIIENTRPSGSWLDVRHAYANGTIYGGGTRYPVTHYEQGRWLCYHTQPGGGQIDFCITN